MKLKNSKKLFTTPLLVSAICALVGGGLLFYYYCFAKEYSAASLVSCYLIIAVGVFSLLSIIYFAVKQNIAKKTLNEGEEYVATYISHDTNVSSQKTNYYSLKYKYFIDGKEIIKKSKYEFTWGEILTLKAVGSFNIKIYKNNIILVDNLEKLFENNKEKVKEVEQRYYNAQAKVEELLNKEI